MSRHTRRRHYRRRTASKRLDSMVARLAILVDSMTPRGALRPVRAAPWCSPFVHMREVNVPRGASIGDIAAVISTDLSMRRSIYMHPLAAQPVRLFHSASTSRVALQMIREVDYRGPRWTVQYAVTVGGVA